MGRGPPSQRVEDRARRVWKPSPMSQKPLWESLSRSFQEAVEQHGEQSWCGRLAGHSILIEGAGTRLLPRLTAALQHWPSGDASRPDLTVHVWEQARPFLPHAQLQSLAGPRPHTPAEGRYYSVLRSGQDNHILSLYDRELREAYFWVEREADLPVWEVGAPLQHILNWWAESRDLQFLHAAAVGSSTGALLLTGKGGSGKSSTALACLQAGLGYLSDDYCLAGAERVHSLYNTAKLVGGPDLERFPELADWVENPQRQAEDKILFHVHRYRPQQMLLEAPVRAVLLPQIGEQTRLTPVGAAQALIALAPTTLLQLGCTRQTRLTQMAAMLRQIPAYRLELGPRRDQLVECLKGLLAGERRI